MSVSRRSFTRRPCGNIFVGYNNEGKISKFFHKEGIGIPLLVSSALLRRYGAGQVDLARVEGRIRGRAPLSFRCGRILEVKSSGGVRPKQRLRLLNSLRFLSMILNIPFLFEELVVSAPESF
ncbi:MAG: hypothetical protein HQK53_02375 [Oligoflexia bacterium]|nr:hypothetical protein [Oligoflexia bacterium]